MTLAEYRKSILSVIFAVLLAVKVAWADGISPVEWVQIGIALVSALLVFTSPNVPGAKYTKETIGITLAVLNGLVVIIVGGVSSDEWLVLGIIAFQAAGVVVPNTPTDRQLRKPLAS